MRDSPWDLWAVSGVTCNGERVLANNQKSINSHPRVLLPLFICMVAGPAGHPSLWYCEVVLERDQEAEASFPTAHFPACGIHSSAASSLSSEHIRVTCASSSWWFPSGKC